MKNKVGMKLVSIMALVLIMGTVDAQVIKTKDRHYKKAVRERTRDLEKAGYAPKGSGSVKLYVQQAVNKEFETDESGETKNSVIYTSAVSPTFQGAVAACRAAARSGLAGNIETNVGELVKISLNTDQISAQSANGISQTITAGKQLIAQKISMDDTYILFREVKDEMDGKTLIEVEYSASFSRKLAMQQAQKYIREEMKDEAEELHKDLDKIFNLD
jgi:RNA 3'-terminal phosphate cyclase